MGTNDIRSPQMPRNDIPPFVSVTFLAPTGTENLILYEAMPCHRVPGHVCLIDCPPLSHLKQQVRIRPSVASAELRPPFR